MFLKYLAEVHEHIDMDNMDFSDKNDDIDFFKQHEPKDISSDEYHAIKNYTDNSKDINRSLWNKTAGGSKIITDIHSGLKKAPPAQNDFHVYTGVNPNKNELKGSIHVPAFTSTSTNPYVAADFVNPDKKRHTTEILTDHRGNSVEHTVHHVIKIHVKKGQQVGGYIPELSHYNTEKEFLINNGHTLHFTGKHEDYKQTPSSTDATPRIYRFHHATITTDD